MTGRLSALAAALVLSAQTAFAQTAAVEVDQTIGRSTDGTSAAATQARTFGDLVAGIRFNVEGAWGRRSDDEGDAFGNAYPYDGRARLIEAYGERLFTPGSSLIVARAGRYRTPFGMYSASDHGYMGFLRPPLVRYDDYYGLSNNFLEHGVDLVVGTPRFSVEASLGAPADVGEAVRRDGLDTVVRGQATLGSLIVGMSHVRSQPYMPATFAFGNMDFTGIDARWMRGGVQARGEWIWGQPFDGTATRGGYLDLIVHRPSMGPFTAVGRVEHLAYDAVAPFAMYAERYTVGGRVRVINQLALSFDLVKQTNALATETPLALDIGLTLSLRHDSGRR